jgi:hypothetical protein
MVYVPVVGKVWVARLKLLLQENEDVRDVLSGFKRLTVTQIIVLPVTWTVACWPEVPVKVRVAFWPGTVVVTVTAAPPMVSVPVASGGTL